MIPYVYNSLYRKLRRIELFIWLNWSCFCSSIACCHKLSPLLIPPPWLTFNLFWVTFKSSHWCVISSCYYSGIIYISGVIGIYKFLVGVFHFTSSLSFRIFRPEGTKLVQTSIKSSKKYPEECNNRMMKIIKKGIPLESIFDYWGFVICW